MSFLSSLSPLLRKPFLWMGTFLLTGALIITLYFVLPPVQKYTLFFSVKPVATEDKSFLNDGVESAEKIAEMIAGWAKSPSFQQDILKIAEVDISGLKRKMAARKQNRLNVFWTLKLSGKDLAKADALITAIQKKLTQTIEDINRDSVIPVKITRLEVAAEPLTIPLSWVMVIAIILGIGFSTLFLYLQESLRGRVSFIDQVEKIFPLSPLLRINTQIGKHDSQLIGDFGCSFSAPKFISTFPIAGKYFELTAISAFQEEHTPILLIQLGNTQLRELENLKAIWGDNVGLIVFEK